MVTEGFPTIYAPICPPGGSISVIRISGTRLDALSLMIDKFSHLAPNKIILSKIVHPINKEFIDSALVSFFPAPHSFTGENIVEISLHGSPYISREVLRILHQECHFDFAKPGEFSQRAFLNGKINLLEAEGINEMIKSETKMQHKIASGLYNGDAGMLYKEWRDEIINIISLFDTSIDFSDEDIPEDVLQNTAQMIDRLIKNLRENVAMQKQCQRIESGIKISIIGTPNVGKSSLINLLSKKNVAIVTEIPGTTRDAIESKLHMDGFVVSVFDTAGIRNSENAIEREGIRRSIDHKKESDFSIVVFDSTKNIGLQLEDISQNINNEDIILLNKTDLISREELNSVESEARNFFSKNIIISTSITKKENVDQVYQEMHSKLRQMHQFPAIPAIINDRQLNAVSNCINTLESLTLNDYPEIICENLRYAALLLEEVVGRISSEDVLDSIFSKFCIGK